MSGKIDAAPLSEAQLAGITRLIARLADRPGVLLELLHGVQELIGYVPAQAVPLIANALNLSRAEVHGVVTFYHYFRGSPGGRRTLRVCRAEACQSMNGRAIEAQARQLLGIGFGETTADGAFSLDAVYCLGLCACAPAVMLDGSVHGRLTPQRLGELLSEPARAPEPPL